MFKPSKITGFSFKPEIYDFNKPEILWTGAFRKLSHNKSRIKTEFKYTVRHYTFNMNLYTYKMWYTVQ